MFELNKPPHIVPYRQVYHENLPRVVPGHLRDRATLSLAAIEATVCSIRLYRFEG